jgi:hypothetical protein
MRSTRSFNNNEDAIAQPRMHASRAEKKLEPVNAKPENPARTKSSRKSHSSFEYSAEYFYAERTTLRSHAEHGSEQTIFPSSTSAM